MSPPESPRKLKVDADLIQSFTDGELSAVVEGKVAAYLDQRPKLIEQAVSLSGENFLARLKDVRQRSISPVSIAPSKELVAAVEIVESPDSKKLSDPKGIPAELANYPAYQITKELGRGGMGVVYLAKNIQMDRLEVLKVLNERLLDHEAAKERFLREVRAVSKLSHPNIVTSYSILPLDSILVFVMEFVNGTDLHEYIHARYPMPVGQACSFATQIATGLQHAYERGLVHRDIKPANVIVYKSDGRMQLKILDFGLAKATSEKNISGLTQDGMMLGTPEYMSPEQTLSAAQADIRADIYSLGCTLYCMLTGNPPFRGTHGEVLMAHAQRVPRSVNLVRPEVPPELATVVDKMMAKAAAKRYQTPEDVIAALKLFIDEPPAADRRGGDPHAASGTVNDLAASDRETSVEAAVPSLSLDTASRLDESKSQLTAIAGMMGDQRRGATRNIRRKQRLQARPKQSWPRWIKPAGIAGILLLFFGALWAGWVLLLRTPEGTIVVEQMPEKAQVFVDGHHVEVTWNDGKDRAEIKIAPGQYKIDVKVNDKYQLQGESVVVDAGKQSSLKVKLAPQSTSLGQGQAESAPDLSESHETQTVVIVSDEKSESDSKEANLNLLAELNVAGDISRLQNGAVAYSNRGHKWTDVPPNFFLKQFARIDVSWEPSIPPIQVNRAGWVYCGVCDEREPPTSIMLKDGWEQTSHRFTYANQKNATLIVYRKFFSFGSHEIRRLHWSGPVLLIPDDAESLSEADSSLAAKTDSRVQEVAGPFQVGTVWTDDTGNRKLTVMTRTSDRFSARFEVGTSIVRDVSGPITGRNLQWLAKDVKAIKGVQGGNNSGTILRDARGTKIDFHYQDSTTASGNFTLRLQSLEKLDWIPLFDGRNLNGWIQQPKTIGSWRVESGAIKGNGTNQSHLFTEKSDYEDFHLRAEARINATGNSGICFRTKFFGAGQLRGNGYEAAIEGDTKVGVQTGSLMHVTRNDEGGVSQPTIQPGEWFTIEVLAMGSDITIRVNGKTTVSYSDNTYARGHIAIQQLGRETVAEFRKIEIRALPAFQ